MIEQMTPGTAISPKPSLIDLMFGSDPSAVHLLGVLQRPVVVDANVLIEDALRKTSGRRCALQVAAEIGTARLLAPPQILSEVTRNLVEACGSKHNPDSVLSTIRASYLPYLRLVDVAGVEIDDPRLASLRSRHPTDLAYVVLALLLAPSVLLTNDRDILDQGLGRYHDRASGGMGWTYGAVSLQDTLVMPAGLLGLTWATAGAMAIGTAGLDLARWFRARPDLLLASGGALIGLSMLARLTGRTVLPRGSRPLLGEIGHTLGGGVVTALELWREATLMLDEGSVAPAGSVGPAGQIARLLSRSSRGLRVGEIITALPSVPEPVPILGAGAPFIEVSPGRWVLGQPAAVYSLA